MPGGDGEGEKERAVMGAREEVSVVVSVRVEGEEAEGVYMYILLF